MSATRDRLLVAAREALAADGIAGVSARTIATRAAVNQALVFYHYGSVDELLAEAARDVSRRRAAVYRERLGEVRSFTALAETARELHREEVAAGNLAVVVQLLAGARGRPALAEVLRENFDLLATPVETTIRRLLAGSPLEGVIDAGHLARGVAGGFLGLQLLDGVVADVEAGPFDALDALAAVVDLALEAGAVESALLRRKLRAARR
ncbi:TetR/AcrR family transcriptional regulator [Egicoccus sp. AB-alg2]|uniref:TetR/AcrR family transcriptional regulator n=1 Tax=Egicoccus sp. AB-alg2 TaxID=3242693 RepID=UPI00359E1E83